MPSLWKTKGAIPFFIAAFLNAFVDLGHKILIQNTVFKLYDGSAQVALTALVNALMLIPFIVLLSPSGYLSDQYRKTRIMQISAWAALGLTLLITLFYYLGLFWLAFGMTLLLATQAAIYSPAKYGYLRELFGKERLGEANGIMSAVSMCAILGGIFAYSIFFEIHYPTGATTEAEVLKAIAPIGWLLVLNAFIELLLLYRLAPQAPLAPSTGFHWQRFFTGRSFIDDLKPLAHSRVIRLAIIGISVFWGVGQVMLAAFPAFIKEELNITNTIAVQGILASTGIGIVTGSALAGKWSRNYINTGLLPFAAIGIAVSLLLLPHLHSFSAFTLVFLAVGVFGGLFIVPLNALVQFNAGQQQLGKILAANNWVQNSVMLSFLLLTYVFSLLQISSKTLLQFIALVALVGCCYTVYQLPQSFMRTLVGYVLSRRYNINIQGIGHIPAQGGVLLLGNHISWIDWGILQLASPRPLRFVMQRSIYERWYLKPFFDLFGCIPIEAGPRSRRALAEVAKALQAGEAVCLFPEGAISRNGHLGPFRPGYQSACEGLDNSVTIVPFYLRGLWGSQFSRSSARLKAESQGFMRDLVVAFGPPLPINTPPDQLKRRVFDLSINAWHDYIDSLENIPNQWITTAKRQGRQKMLFDTLGATLNGYQALTGAITLAKRIKPLASPHIGLILPTSAGGMLTNMAVLLAGKTLVNLNYTASQQAFCSALEQANITHVFTSARFLTKLDAKGLPIRQWLAGKQVIELETLSTGIRWPEKLLTLCAVTLLPNPILKKIYGSSAPLDGTAALLFSSGSEGTPKGVQISHKNILANVQQVTDVLNPQAQDVILANLPLFHAFGLTVTQFLPLLQGLPVVTHADPTDALGTAHAIARYRATLLFGTSTFLRLYVRSPKVHPLMLDSLRLVVAGAEKLNPEVRSSFQQKFNKTIYEGYGATETTPVASVNLPDVLETTHWHIQLGHRQGSVGLPLPGTSCRIVDPASLNEMPTGEAGMILIGGPQVMTGYFNQPEKTAQAITHMDNMRWYITGDKGYLDADGFLFIVDRYSRFAKLGGEMLSLSQIEAAIVDQAETPDAQVVVVAIPCAKKGERLIALHTHSHWDTRALEARLLATGLNALALPSQWLEVPELPLLGSGKVDFAGAKAIALQGAQD